METARKEQFRAVQMIQLLVGVGFFAGAKAAMKMSGVDVGPARLPHSNLDADQVKKLRVELEKIGFFARDS
jgi:N-acetylneuraminate lyase